MELALTVDVPQWWLVECIVVKYLPGILSLSLKTVTAASRSIVQVNP
jgi:hypothetical protein